MLLRGIRCLPEFGIRCGLQPGQDDVLNRFNRDTRWFTIGLLGSVFLAALVFGVLLPEHYRPSQEPRDLTSEARQSKSDFLPNVEAATPFEAFKQGAKSSTSGVTVKTSTPPDIGCTEISSNQVPVPMESSTDWAPPSVSTLSPHIDRTSTQRRNGSKWSLVRRADPGAKREKIAHERYGLGPHGFFSVKMQLVALWHSSLLRSEARLGRNLTPPTMRTRLRLW